MAKMNMQIRRRATILAISEGCMCVCVCVCVCVCGGGGGGGDM